MRALILACVTLCAAMIAGPATAERWVQVAPWFFLDLDSIRREGAITYYVMAHSSAADIDPRAAGMLWNIQPPVSYVDCNTGVIYEVENGAWVAVDELFSDDPSAPYLCPNW